MSIRGKSEKTQIEMNPQIFEQINSQSDKRVKMIYDRYRTGKSIIIDDLQYLWLKDPEGCKKLTRSIVEAKTGKGLENEFNNKVSIGDRKKNTESTMEPQNHIDYKPDSDTSIDLFGNVLETMTSVKLMIEKMSKRELMDMLTNMNEALELKKLTNKMKYWDDTFEDKMVMYTYDEEKKFEISV